MGNEETNCDKPVIVQYVVEGIQEYIFRSNRLKEIAGASYIVDQIFNQTLCKVIKRILESIEKPIEMKDTTIEQYIFDWKENNKGYLFDSDQRIQMEVLFANAGNATVLYRSRAVCIAVNKEFTKYILKNISGLRLSIGITEKTDCYQEDYKRLTQNLEKVKAAMPVVDLGGKLPIIKCETGIGMPLSKYSKERKEYVSVETYNKLLNYQESERKKEENNKERSNFNWNKFDNLIEQKGESSLLAIVHIDGNNMGNQIRSVINSFTCYTETVQKMKQISCHINEIFNKKAFEKMILVLENWISQQKESDITYHRYLREIVNAGDDVTFICTAKLALELSRIYLKEISKYSLVKGGNKFSACAGIAIINSHFPFNEGYKAAEECCKQAKKRAKELSEDKNNVGTWIDFQVCKNMYISNDFERVRDYQYHLPDNTYLLKRPYRIATNSYPVSEKLESYNYEQFINQFHEMIQNQKISTHWLIELRNAYCEGEREASLVANKIRACGFTQIKDLYMERGNRRIAQYFDMLEMLEWYTVLDGEEKFDENL